MSILLSKSVINIIVIGCIGPARRGELVIPCHILCTFDRCMRVNSWRVQNSYDSVFLALFIIRFVKMKSKYANKIM